MSERRTPYRAPRRRPLEPQAPLRPSFKVKWTERQSMPLMPMAEDARDSHQDERAIAERLLLDLTAYYGVQGWRGVDGALAGRCRITIQALLGALAAAQKRQTPSATEGNAHA